MMTHLIVLGALFTGPVPMHDPEDALTAVQELYSYSTQAVQVEPAEVRRMLANIEQHVDSPSEPVAQALEGLAAEVHQEQPDGRAIRVAASEVYRALEVEGSG